jgi:hypothetical protein
MSSGRMYTDSDYPVTGNVLLVATLQKCNDAPFVIPMAGRYLDDIADDRLSAAYAGQEQVDGTNRYE